MLFCEHDYEEFNKTDMKSAYEQVVASGKNYTSVPHNPWVFRKKLVILLKCKKCKRIKKIIEENPV